MSVKLFLILLISIRPSSSDLVSYEKVLDFNLQRIPYIRLELREGISSDLENKYVKYFLNQKICPMIISTYSLNVTKPLPNRKDNFAIVSEMTQMRSTVKFFSENSGMFLFIIVDDIDLPELESIFQNQWKTKGIYKNVLLTLDGLKVFNPFLYDADKDRFGGIEVLGKTNLVRLFDNMNGYPLRVQVFRSVYSRPVYDADSNTMISNEGADAMVATELQKHMNFSMIFQKPSKDYFGERAPNGSYNGAIAMVINNETDIVLTGFFMKDYLVPLEFTATVYHDLLCCYVPKAERIPPSILPICAVRPNFWLAFIAAAFLCGTIWVILRVYNLRLCRKKQKQQYLFKNIRFRHQVLRIFNDTWVVWVRTNVVKYPPFNSERIILISMCLVSVILGAIIESSLATVYIHPMYYKDIDNLHELEESGLDIFYKFTSFKDDLFFSETSPLFAALNKKLKYIDDLDADLIKDLVDNGTFASVTRFSSLVLESNEYILSKKIHLIGECPKDYLIAYVLPRNSPFGEKINELLLRFLNAGLINKWIGDMHAQADREIMKLHIVHANLGLRVLTLVDLQLAFYVIIVGSLISFLTLAVEMYIKRRNET